MQKKSKVLNHGCLVWRYAQMRDEIHRLMRCFPSHGLRMGKVPPEPDVQRAVAILSLGLDLPEMLRDATSASANMRLELTNLILGYPAFAVAAIYCCFVPKPVKKRKPGVSGASLVREFLLTEAIVKLPNGKQMTQVGATDGEIAMAIEEKYGVASPSVKAVASARKRLEKALGTSVATLVDFCLDTTAAMDRLGLDSRKKAREKRRAEMMKAFSKPL